MEFVLIKIQSEAWNEMWDWLKAHPLNSGLEPPDLALNPDTNSGWQYIISYKKGDIILHEFWHTNHPTTNKFEKIVYRGNSIKDDDVERYVKIKR